MKHIYTSVDIGTDSIKVVTCELFRNKLNLLAASSVKSEGIKRGLITDVELARESYNKAIYEVEQMLGVKIKKVIASVPSYFSNYIVVNSTVDISNEVVETKDILEALREASIPKIKKPNEMVTVIPIDFKIDGGEAVLDPKGLTGEKLSARAILVTAPRKNIVSVLSLINQTNQEVIDISINAIGDMYALKNDYLDNKIGAIINIGAETTSVSLYNKGIIVRNAVIQLGGSSVDSDISYIYKLDKETARSLKEKFALAHKMYAKVNETREVVNKAGNKVKVNQYEISEIAMVRLEEILELAKKEINSLTNRKIDYIIVTGGTSNMAHFNYIAETVFGKMVSVGNLTVTGVRNNKYVPAIGNIVYFISTLKLKGQQYSMFSKNDVEALSSAKRNFLDDNNGTMVGKVFGYFFNE